MTFLTEWVRIALVATFDLTLPTGTPSTVTVAQPVTTPSQEVPLNVKNKLLIMIGKPSLLVP